MRLLYSLLALFVCFANCELLAQNEEVVSKRAARGFFKLNNYRQALEEYEKLLSKDSTNIEYNHNIGLCYFYTNIDKSKAIPYLEYVTNQTKAPVLAWYDLGRAYQIQYEFDKAIEAYNTYLNVATKDDNYISAKRQIEMCYNAKEFIKKEVDVKFERITSDINSIGPDYNPYVTKDESMLVFTSKRHGNIGGVIDYDGFNTPNVFYSQNKNGFWQKSRRFPNTINSPFIEESVGLSSDGLFLFLYIDNMFVSGDIYFTQKVGRGYGRIQHLGRNVNTKYLETSATITQNKRMLIFAADYPGGYGGLDLYYSLKLPNGTWGTPINLGATINTAYDEEFPYISPDGNYLYFASTGHNSMGGYDIFKSIWDKENMIFSKPVNLAYPINTPNDETVISFTQSGRFAYMSKYMNDSKGDLDIYKLTFNSVKPAIHCIRGKLINSDQSLFFKDYLTLAKQLQSFKIDIDSLDVSEKLDSTDFIEAKKALVTGYNYISNQIKAISDFQILVYSQVDNSICGTFRPNKKTSNFVILLPYGKYRIEFKCQGYKIKEFEVELKDIEVGEVIEDKTITMEKED